VRSPRRVSRKAKKVVRLFTDLDQFLTHRLAVTDAGGERVLTMERPAKVMKSKIKIQDGSGAERGTISQGNIVGKKHFSLSGASGEVLGTLDAENWRSWDFSIRDAGGPEVGRITKKWAGLIKEGFTTADTYILQITDPAVSKDLRFLMLAAAASIDVALKQDDSGGWGFGGIG
jgi:uncharacterized protein YxjI